MINPNPDMLVRIALGDAYGMATEYIKLPQHQGVKDAALRFDGYGVNPVHPIAAGAYTDDTQMSIAVAEVLVGGEPGREEFADSFVRCFKRDERPGYSGRISRLLKECRSGRHLLDLAEPTSDANGAAMRSVPLGVIKRLDVLMGAAKAQGGVTHGDEGVTASLAVALMSHFTLHTNWPLKDLPEWLNRGVNVPEWTGGPVEDPKVGMRTARAVMTLVSREETLLGIARRAIEWGGDTDTVLAVSWGIASARMREPLPGFFNDSLENGEWGRDFLGRLGSELMEKYGA